MLDLDRFKEVNDSLGHLAGDALLQEVAHRIQRSLRACDAVARLWGDEFGILLTAITGEPDIVAVIDRIAEANRWPIVVQEMSLAVEASIGVAVFPEHGADIGTLLEHADVAMYAAKEQNRRHAFYDPRHQVHNSPPATLVADLERAIADRELHPLLPTKADLETGEVRSVEALLRWKHRDQGWIEPDAFIPAARETGVIKPLTLYVLEEALRQVKAWRSEGVTLAIAVNVATRNLLDVQFPGQVADLLEQSGLDASVLQLEITEATIFANPFRAREAVEALTSLGVTVSIDDFGTGYSSLAYLTRLPVSELKIDRAFVMRMLTAPDDAVIVRSIIDLGRNLDLAIVAEGVETKAIWDRLGELGATEAQGFHLSPALPAGELRDWLVERRDGKPRPPLHLV